MRRLVLAALALALLPVPAAVWADEPTERQEIVVPPPPAAPIREPSEPEAVVVEQEAVVAAPPPPLVELRSAAIAAGIGMQWGRGVLNFEGRDHAFRLRGLSAGDVGLARTSAVGGVENLERVEDFPGRYVAVEAGATVGLGVSAVRMRNERGVVITLRSRQEGGRLTLGAKGLLITLE